MIQKEEEQHLASPVAIKHDIKKVVDMMGVEILDPRILPDTFFTSNEAFKTSRDLPKPNGLKLEDCEGVNSDVKPIFDTGAGTESPV